MKYQKSILKILGFLFQNIEKPIIIENIIKNTKIGRTSCFQSLAFLEKKGFILIKKVGKQKEVSLNTDRNTINFKLFFDSLTFKNLPEKIKFTINFFIEQLKKIQDISVILFGSVLSKMNKESDIDLLIICNKTKRKEIINIRNKTEILLDFIINLHFSDGFDEKIIDGLCLYGKEKYTNLILNQFDKRKKIKENFEESSDWLLRAYNNIKNKKFFKECLNNTLLNLGFALSGLEDKKVKIKEDAKTILGKRYKNLHNLNKIEPVKSIKIIKKIWGEIGERIYK